MVSISVEKDQFSIQVASASAKRLYVRVSDPNFIGERVKISDFFIEAGDVEGPRAALLALRSELPLMFEARQWDFADLLPRSKGIIANSDPALVRRFDEIRSILQTFFSDGSRTIDNCYIEPRHGKFDGVFLFRRSCQTQRDP